MDREGYLKLVFGLGTTPNGVFGAKLMWNNVPWVLEKLWELPRFAGLDRTASLHELVPDLRVITVTRRDRLRQPVSWARAEQHGGPGRLWYGSGPPVAEPAYSYEFSREIARPARK
jgi:trehalose 2-sulfotransferase